MVADGCLQAETWQMSAVTMMTSLKVISYWIKLLKWFKIVYFVKHFLLESTGKSSVNQKNCLKGSIIEESLLLMRRQEMTDVPFKG